MKRILTLIFCCLLASSLQAKRIVVTGGAGLIGSHLCERLLEEGHEVICLDNLSSGNIENLQQYRNHPRFHFIEHDICDPFEYGLPLDEIYNLACPASPVHYQADPIQTLQTNFAGAKNMLDLAKAHDAKFLHTSTSEVYGDPEEHPQREDYWGHVNPIGIRACYDEGKRVAETLIFAYRQTYGIDTKIVRIFNTYGPNMKIDDGRVISNFVVQALRGEPITVYGSGQQTRSICYVSDMVDGLIRMMGQPPACSGPVNLGNPCEMTILELAEKVIALTGSSSEIVFLPLPQDDPKKRRPDITRAGQLLGWQPTTDADQGLLQTIEYFAER